MLSPAKAAKRANVSRRAIMFAIESHKLKASRNNKNHWQIDPVELEKWMEQRPERPSPSTETSSETPTETSSETSEMLLKINTLEVELKAANERLDEVKEDRDRWYDQAQKLAEKPAKKWWPF
jgi:uncharacterized coiled-coil DUF342 family protein